MPDSAESAPSPPLPRVGLTLWSFRLEMEDCRSILWFSCTGTPMLAAMESEIPQVERSISNADGIRSTTGRRGACAAVMSRKHWSHTAMREYRKSGSLRSGTCE